MDVLSYLEGVHGDGFGGVVRLVNAHQAIGKFKHVVSEADDDKLGILGTLLQLCSRKSDRP